VRRTGDDGQFDVGEMPVHLDGVLKAHLVVVGDHDQRRAGDLAQVRLTEGGLAGVHRGQLLDHDVVVRRAVR
jgi:hypothetical protein